MKHRNIPFSILILILLAACTPAEGVNSPAPTFTTTHFVVPVSTLANPTPEIALGTPSQIPLILATPDIVALKTQGIIDPQLVAVMDSEVKPPIISEMVLFSPDNRILAVSVNNHVSWWGVGTYKKLYDIPLPETYKIDRFAFGFKGEYLAVVARDRDDRSSRLFAWNTVDGKQVLTLPMDFALLTKENQMPYKENVTGIGFIPNSNILVYGDGTRVQLVDLDNQVQKVTLELGQNMYATDLSFPPDGRFIYVFMDWWQNNDFPSNYRTQYVLQIWDSVSHILRRTITFPEIECCISMSLDRSFLLTKDYKAGTLELRNLENDKVIQLPFRRGRDYLSANAQFDVIIRYTYDLKDQDEGIEFWIADTWQKIYVFRPGFSMTDSTLDPGEVVISNDNSLLAIAHYGEIYVYDIRMITNR